MDRIELPHNSIESNEFPADFWTKFIMTSEEYAELGNHKVPYRYELKGGDKQIIYLGVEHSSDPTYEGYQILRTDLENFRPEVIMVEGMIAINRLDKAEQKTFAQHYNSTEEFIKHHGESAYAAKLAIDSGIEVISPEPSEMQTVNYLLERGASKELIFVEGVITLLHQYHWLTDKPGIEQYLSPYLNVMASQWDWEDFDFSYGNFQELFQKNLGVQFDLENQKLIKKLNDPIPWPGQPFTEVNQVSQLTSECRDNFMISKIAETMKHRNKLYVIYGASHAVMQEPALSKLIESYQNVKEK